MRRSTFIVGILAVVIGLVLFRVKYTVMALEQQYHRVDRAILENKEAIHVLRAEWAHLNDPGRLQKLAGKYLDITPTQAGQVVNLKDLTGKNTESDRRALEALIAQAAADSPKTHADTE